MAEFTVVGVPLLVCSAPVSVALLPVGGVAFAAGPLAGAAEPFSFAGAGVPLVVVGAAAGIGIDSFQADRAPDNVYKTVNLGGIFVRERGLFMADANKGRFYHDGRFQKLLDVVNHYNTHFALGLTDQEKGDVVEYLKSLTSP